MGYIFCLFFIPRTILVNSIAVQSTTTHSILIQSMLLVWLDGRSGMACSFFLQTCLSFLFLTLFLALYILSLFLWALFYYCITVYIIFPLNSPEMTVCSWYENLTILRVAMIIVGCPRSNHWNPVLCLLKWVRCSFMTMMGAAISGVSLLHWGAICVNRVYFLTQLLTTCLSEVFDSALSELFFPGEKVGAGHVCLWCNEKGKRFHNTRNVQRHMVDKCHCKLLHEGEAIYEFADFYDYT